MADTTLNFVHEIIRRDIHLFRRDSDWICYGKISGILEIVPKETGQYIQGLLDGNEPACSIPIRVSIARLANAIASQKVVRQDVGKVLSTQLNMTDSCNMGCSYCYGTYYANDPRKTSMSSETACRAMDFSNAIGASSIGFFGGEPLLNYAAIREAVTYSKVAGYGFSFGMTTNGVMLTPEIADFLASNDFMVSVSIDGPRYVNDATRRLRDGTTSSFDKVWNGIELLKERGILEMLEMTYSNKHPTELRPILDWLSQHSDYISCTCVEGTIDSRHSDEVIRGERLVAYYNQTLDFHESQIEENESSAGQLLGIRELVGALEAPVSVIREHVCSSLLDRVSIGYDGSVYPCPETMNDDFYIINVHNAEDYDKFPQIRNRVLEKLKKGSYQDLWFGNLMDVCIGRVKRDANGDAMIDDVDSISLALEDVLWRVAKRKMLATAH